VCSSDLYGIHAVLVGPGADRGFRNPRKFAGRFKELWRNGDDVIYEVPQRSESLAHALTPRDLAAREPVNGIDIDPLRPYVAALDNPALPPADFRWINRHRATVKAALQRNEILSIQIAYHPGWRATVRGEPRPAYRDRLGLLAVEPKCDGPCTVELTYDGGLEMHLARLLSWTALAGGIFWVLGSAVIPYWAAGSRPT
jgi:hypothetical protein